MSVISTGCATCHVIDSSRIQRKSNRKYNGSCYQRWKYFSDLINKKSNDHRNDTTDDLCSKYRRNTCICRNRLHTCHICKLVPIITGNPAPMRKPFFRSDRKTAVKVWKCGNYQCRLNQHNTVGSLKTCDTCHNDCRGYTAYDHRYYMLQCQRKCLTQLRNTV